MLFPLSQKSIICINTWQLQTKVKHQSVLKDLLCVITFPFWRLGTCLWTFTNLNQFHKSLVKKEELSLHLNIRRQFPLPRRVLKVKMTFSPICICFNFYNPPSLLAAAKPKRKSQKQCKSDCHYHIPALMETSECVF